MKFPYMTITITSEGGKRSPVSILVIYLAFIAGRSEVYAYQGPPNTCGLQDGCMFDVEIGILNCQNLEMQNIPLQICPEVTHLDLRYNNFAKLTTRIHTYFPNLRILDLGATQVTIISPKVFDKCDALNLLYLDSNKITSLKRGSFEELTSLEYLYLSGNEIGKIQTQIFDPLNKTLLYLDLSHNEIQRIEEGSFQHLRVLQRLFLQQNKLVHINSGMLQGLRQLTHLYISDNNIEYIPHNAFQDMPNLKQLKLGNNPELVSVHSGALYNLKQLTFLDLMQTGLPSLMNISHLFFSDYKLKTFFISDTPLTCDESFDLWEEWFQDSTRIPRHIAKCSKGDTDKDEGGIIELNTAKYQPLISASKQPISIYKQHRLNKSLEVEQFPSNDGRQNKIQTMILTAVTLISLIHFITVLK